MRKTFRARIRTASSKRDRVDQLHERRSVGCWSLNRRPVKDSLDDQPPLKRGEGEALQGETDREPGRGPACPPSNAAQAPQQQCDIHDGGPEGGSVRSHAKDVLGNV